MGDLPASHPALFTQIAQYFGLVNANDIQGMVGMFAWESMPKGDWIAKAGQRCDRLSFILKGLTRTYVEVGDKEVTQWIGFPETFITDINSLVFEQPARWHIQTLTEVELLTIKRTDYQRLGQMIPEWHLVEKLFIAKCFALLEERVFVHLSLNAEERYALFLKQYPALMQQVPQQYIASMLGMTPETFSRIRRKQLS